MKTPNSITHSTLDFDKGMTPKVFTPNGATRIEHFDTLDGKLRPFRTLSASTFDNTTPAVAKITNFEQSVTPSGQPTLYAIGVDYTTPTYGALYRWDTSGFDTWENMYSMGSASSPNAMLQTHASYLFGLRNNRYIWRYDIALNTYSLSFVDTGASYTNGFSDPIVHSKDGICYIPIDNKIYAITSTGASGALALTLPNSNFLIKSICEQGNYINIVGYDIRSQVSSSLLWDRDTSVADVTESIQLGTEQVYHNVTLGGNTFFIMLRYDAPNSSWVERPTLVIKYLNGNIAETLAEYPFVTLNSNMMGGKYESSDRLYFACAVSFNGEAARNVVFSIDRKGKLFIAQNASVNTDVTTYPITGLLRQGESFWLCAKDSGAWNTKADYTTVSSFETTDLRSDDLSQAISFSEAYVMCEPLPSTSSTINAGSFAVGLPYTILTVGTTDFTAIGASANTVGVKFVATGVGTGNGTATLASAIVLKARRNEDGTPVSAGSFVVGKTYAIAFIGSTDFTLIGATSNTLGLVFTATGVGTGSGTAVLDWFTLATFTGTNRIKFKLGALQGANGLSLKNVRQARLRLESTVGAVITGFQATFISENDTNNG